MRNESTAKVLAGCKLKYYRISEYGTAYTSQPHQEGYDRLNSMDAQAQVSGALSARSV